MRFVHAADIHLDSPLRGLERYEGAPLDAIRGATRRALENLVDLALEEEAALLLIAGDLYDGDWRDYHTGLFFAAQAARLTRAGCRVAVLRGNHDAASRITKTLPLPEGVIEFATRRAQTHLLEDLGVALHGRSYGKPAVDENIAAHYPHAVAGYFNIGLLHTALEGRANHDPYAPCRLDDLAGKGYGYWALGHVHAREIVSRDPWVVFPGNIQGRHARETGPKGATLVEVDDGEVRGVEHRDLDVVRWAVCEVDLGDAATPEEALARVREAVAREADAAGDRLLAVRLRLVGRSAAHEALARAGSDWVNQCRASLFDLGDGIWLEKIELRTASAMDLDALAARDDPLGGLVRSMRAARGDAQALAAFAAEFEALTSKLPAEYRARADAIRLDDPEGIAALFDDASSLLLARLVDPEPR